MCRSNRGRKALLAALLLVLSACQQDMAREPRYNPYSAKDDSPTGASALPPVAGTVARGELEKWALLPKRGPQGYEPGTPFELSDADRARGRERYYIFCAPCHGARGRADGEVVRRGFPRPPDFMAPDLVAAPPGYMVDIETRGAGRMPSYAAQVPIRDRWLIAVYVKQLQAEEGG